MSLRELGDSGRVLVNSAGQALYAAQEETESSVVCNGACTSFWIRSRTMRAPGGNSVAGELGVLERAEGTRQVTFDGERLYTFVSDEPAEVTGDGLSDTFDGQTFTWHVVRVDGSHHDDAAGGSVGYP